jgi:hypothetical protein
MAKPLVKIFMMNTINIARLIIMMLLCILFTCCKQNATNVLVQKKLPEPLDKWKGWPGHGDSLLNKLPLYKIYSDCCDESIEKVKARHKNDLIITDTP